MVAALSNCYGQFLSFGEQIDFSLPEGLHLEMLKKVLSREMEPNQWCRTKQHKLSCFCTAADCNSSFHWSRQWLKFRNPTTKIYSSYSMGKTTSLFYGYQKQGYKSGGSDVTLEVLNHRITKKCTDFSWIKEESWGRESFQTSSHLQTSLSICVLNSTTVIYGTSIIHFFSILDSQLLVPTCSHNSL